MIRRFAGWLFGFFPDDIPVVPEKIRCRIGWHHLRLIDTPNGYVFTCTLPGCTQMPEPAEQARLSALPKEERP